MKPIFFIDRERCTLFYDNTASYLWGLITEMNTIKNPETRKRCADEAIDVLDCINSNHGFTHISFIEYYELKRAIEELGKAKHGIDSWKKFWKTACVLSEVRIPGDKLRLPKIEFKRKK